MSATNRPKIRFTPDSDELGFISFNLVLFQKEITALILNESTKGACLAINRKLIPSRTKMSEGLRLLVKIGNLEPEMAVVRWVILVDDDLIKIGIEHEQ